MFQPPHPGRVAQPAENAPIPRANFPPSLVGVQVILVPLCQRVGAPFTTAGGARAALSPACSFSQPADLDFNA